jgi:hypothetical protein
MEQDIKQEFESLRHFLQQNMATKHELEELRSQMVTKEELRVLTNSIDAKIAQDYFQEMTVMSARQPHGGLDSKSSNKDRCRL